MMAPEDDVDAIMRIMQAAFDPQFGEAWNRSQVMDALILGNCHYGLRELGGQTPNDSIAAAGFYLSRHGFEEEELLLLAVDPRFRRRGIGQNLLTDFANSARSRGAKRLLLEMRRGNPASRLYIQFGFNPIGERTNYYRGANGLRFDAITFSYEYE